MKKPQRIRERHVTPSLEHAVQLAFFLAMSLLILTSCASKKPLDAVTLDPETQDISDLEFATVTTGEEANADRGIAPRPVVYFDFDSSEVRPEFHEALRNVARRLASSEQRSLRLEGHADERGSREYNVGLGERRAQSVRRFLLLSGALESQLSTVSYGEERPANLGSTDASWSKNRRVELVGG